MARPRTVSDTQILDALERVLDREGPLRFTLDDVARELGVTAPALVSRFGSKRQLMLAVVERGVVRARAPFAQARQAHEAPLDALVAALSSPARDATPEGVANGLAFLQVDVTDDEFRALALEYFDAVREETRLLVEEAVKRRDLARGVDALALARALERASNGAMLFWAIERDGAPEDAVRAAVLSVLAPHRRGDHGIGGASSPFRKDVKLPGRSLRL